MIHSSTIKKAFLFLLIAINLNPVLFAFAEDAPEGGSAAEGASAADEQLATSPSECKSRDINGVHRSPRNCLFLEEPIGGKPGYDLYVVSCTGSGSEEKCSTNLWRGGAIGAKDRGPIQAILTEDPDKPYQGPFGLLYGYLGLIYSYMSGLIVGVAVLFVVIGGIQMSTSGGDESKFSEGKSRITKAITGIILWFTASLILYTINPTFFAF